MKRWSIMIAVVVLLLGTVLGFNALKSYGMKQYFAHMPPPVFPVTTMKVTTQDWTPTIEAIGFIEPNQGVMVRSEAAGVIRELGFESGDKVEKGQLLAALDNSVEQANLKAAQAKMPAAKAQYERLKTLYRDKSASKGQLDEAEANYQSLVAEIESLNATIGRRTIKAPFAGVVGLRNIYLGQYLQNGSDVVRLEDQHLMRIRFTVSQNDLSRIEKGQTVSIKVDAYPDTPFSGQITAIEPVVNAESGVVNVQADIPNNDGQLRSGMFAKVEVTLPTLKDQVVIPQTAIEFALYGQTVYVMQDAKDDSGKAYKAVRQLTVQVAERRGDVARLTGGLEPGMELVTAGQVRLYNGAHVDVKQDSLGTDKPLPRL
ncbi:efflux RND transporter periplasmic adaptor subunit [Gallaecimonas kandeliae]|uniref:efflux RND transporter periplasmic adaptor subunit n=1 Tax=Gallaecimonas kandeliae TaxID=3029055 RepID=UPI00264960FE|nr:efflux RND transporter periplasmic adaptor subunit [Gallaecimonas kandeliae]WKE65611.1 efflux RND transporter periplasmic adaptor subunit [Gallaecimonas kandeliae]